MLSPLIETITESELRFIAALDYGQDLERHLVELHSVVFAQDGNLQADQRWHPYEVIELGSHALQPGHEREFFFCTMLVLQAAASGYDKGVDLSQKLSYRAGDYDLLSPELRDEVLSAYQRAGA